MDGLIAYAIAKTYAKGYVDSKIGAGLTDMHYKGSVSSKSDLPTDAELGDVYTVTGTGSFAWDGTAWAAIGIQGIQGEKGEKGDPGDMVSKQLWLGQDSGKVYHIYETAAKSTPMTYAEVKKFVYNTAYYTIIYVDNYVLYPTYLDDTQDKEVIWFTAITTNDSTNKRTYFRVTINESNVVTSEKIDLQDKITPSGTLDASTTQIMRQIEIDGTKWKMATETVDNLNQTTAGQALDAHQGYVLNTSKASLVNGKVPLSQLPDFIMEEVVQGYATKADKQPYGSDEVPTDFYEDAEHTKHITPESIKTYVDITPNTETVANYGRTFRWIGNSYIDMSNQSQQYYSLSPNVSTMGEFRKAINNINDGGSHVFLDLHDKGVTDGYVCTVHFYPFAPAVGDKAYCYIYNLLNNQIIFNPTGYGTFTSTDTSDGDSTLLTDYVGANTNQWGTYTAGVISGDITMADLRNKINGVNTSGLHSFFDLSSYLNEAYVCTVHFYTSNSVNYCQILDLLNHRVVLNTSGYTDATTVAAYCQTTTNQWATARDIRINGTSIIGSDEIANITDALLADVKYTTQSLTDAQKTVARSNIGAGAPIALQFLEDDD